MDNSYQVNAVASGRFAVFDTRMEKIVGDTFTFRGDARRACEVANVAGQHAGLTKEVAELKRQRAELRKALADCNPIEDDKCVCCGRGALMHAADCLWLRAVNGDKPKRRNAHVA